MNKSIKSYLVLSFSLLITFLSISLFEVLYSLFSQKESISIFTTLLSKFINHAFTGVLMAIIFFPFFYLLNLAKENLGVLFIKIVFVLLVVIEFALTKYSLTTLLNLGADFLGYSFDDIYLTVSSSEDTSILYFLTFLLFPFLFFIVYYACKKIVIRKKYRIGLFVLLILIICSKFIFSEISEAKNQNKTYYFIADVLKFKVNKTEVSLNDFKGENEYPLLKNSNTTNDVLGSFFNVSKEKPNIVFIIVEGLGTEFLGDENYGGFTPYLDSLIPKSLFWENFVSNAGRTFGALPSILGSLPFGEEGFSEIPNTPSHISILSILKENGYTTSFYSGDKSSFDKKIKFLEYNGIDNVIDENKYNATYPKSVNASNGFSWGYSDNEIFTKTLSVLDDRKSPRLDVIATQTIHEPFTFPEKEAYLLKVDSLLNFKIPASDFIAYKDIFASILYADNSIKKFMKAYEKRPEFNNTVFIITGDHRLIPISQKDKLCRFNVPLYIYSPMLKRTSRIKSISSHFDISPSILSFLSNNYNVELPEKTAFIGSGLDTVSSFRNIHNIPLMRYKGGLNDFIYKEYLYSGGDLFKIKENFSINKITNDTILNEVVTSFDDFKNINAYVTQNDKIYPKELLKEVASRYQFTEKEKAKISLLVVGLSLDQVFLLAREKAFNKEREIARLLCNHILSNEPNYVDVILLKARTLGWDGNYKESEKVLFNALDRSPYYYDIYLAFLDMYWWSSQYKKAENIFQKAKKNNIKNDSIAFKMARVYSSMKNIEKAEKVIDSILKKQPKNDGFLKFKDSLE
ncbi:sulfatase-like hydrolase/transferase [Polaribacter sp. SA4-12]|uniref:sulfatase-like hydrolase/transferase n=1 Tax=Polaribacter sp. SA4-12 TaxID=1312072 RepID=UPI001E36E976|nr:sulfatase-like hydrolase/transferase [Polaribacter sp. SA4-12]